MGLQRDFARALGQIRGAWGDRGLRQPLNSGSYVLIPYWNNVTKRSFPLKNREQQNTEPKLELIRQWPEQFRAPRRAHTDGSQRQPDPGGAMPQSWHPKKPLPWSVLSASTSSLSRCRATFNSAAAICITRHRSGSRCLCPFPGCCWSRRD